MSSVLIVEDEPSAREIIRTLLSTYFPDIKILGETGDILAAFAMINDLNPDFIFLDIHMPKGTGFNLLNKFDSIPFETILLTGYDNYGIPAIKYNVIDYLLKPIDISEFQIAVQKVNERINEKKILSEASKTHFNIAVSENKNDSISVHFNDKVLRIKLADIEAIYADGRYSQFKLTSGEKLMATRTLKNIEASLSDYKEFIRINKSVIINCNSIKEYQKGDSFIITMISSEQINVSRRKKSFVLDHLSKR